MTSAQIIALARKKIMEKTDEIFSDDDLLLYANNGKDEIAMRFLGKKLIKPATLIFSGGSVTKPTDWNGHYYALTGNVPRQGTEVKLISIEDYQNASVGALSQQLPFLDILQMNLCFFNRR